MADLEDSMIKALEILATEAGNPESMWHSDFGWVLIDSKPTESTQAFLDMLKAHENKPTRT